VLAIDPDAAMLERLDEIVGFTIRDQEAFSAAHHAAADAARAGGKVGLEARVELLETRQRVSSPAPALRGDEDRIGAAVSPLGHRRWDRRVSRRWYGQR